MWVAAVVVPLSIVNALEIPEAFLLEP